MKVKDEKPRDSETYVNYLLILKILRTIEREKTNEKCDYVPEIWFMKNIKFKKT